MVSVDRLAEQAQRFRALHVPGRPVVLPNAWDAASARSVAAAGFPAVATASSAIATTLGYEDGEQIPAEQMFAAVARISRAVDLPVSADIESGYGLDPAAIVDLLLEAGAVGCNLEDTDHTVGGLVPVDEQAARIRRLREAADSAGVAIVINARVDVYLREIGAPDSRLDEAIRRGSQYRLAGADCIYPIMLTDEGAIAALVEAFDGMVNVYARPEAPSVARLAELGVARVSYGPWIHRLAMRTVDAVLAEVMRGSDPYAARQ